MLVSSFPLILLQAISASSYKVYTFMKKMPIVWNALYNTSGDRCLLGGVKFLIVPSSEQQLAPCQWDFADILRMTWWWASALTVDAWTEFFCYHPFHTLKYSRFITTLRSSHKRLHIIFLESQQRNLKIKSPLCSAVQALHVTLWFDITEIPGEALQAGRRPRSKTSGFWTCARLTLMILFVISNGAEKRGSPMSRRSCCWI